MLSALKRMNFNTAMFRKKKRESPIGQADVLLRQCQCFCNEVMTLNQWLHELAQHLNYVQSENTRASEKHKCADN